MNAAPKIEATEQDDSQPHELTFALKRSIALVREAKITGYALALFDTGPKPRDAEMEKRWRQQYREMAEQAIAQSETRASA